MARIINSLKTVEFSVEDRTVVKKEEYPYYINMLNQWLILKQEGKKLDDYLYAHNYKKVAIYGMGVYGRHLVRDLAGGKISIEYGIDKKAMEPYLGINVYKPEGTLPGADLVINSVICCPKEVIATLDDVVNAPIMGLDYLVHESYFCG